MKDLVSVIIPVYNSSDTLGEVLKSVINQTYKNIEIIVIDDCSTDNSYEVIQEIKNDEKRIRLYKNKVNLGVANTRNIGIEKANGNFISFIDSDDLWINNKIEKQIEYINKKNADICYTGYYIEKNYNIPITVEYRDLLKENIICCSTVLIKSKVFKKYKFNRNYFHEDFVLWLELLRNGYRAVGLNEVLTVYRKGGRSSNKLKASKNRWIVYRECETLNIFTSIYYFIIYTINGIKKYYTKFF